jgi:predicted Zn-ribbon and HTH transcriptional regulator
VHRHAPSAEERGAGRPRLEVADIVRAHGEAYLHRHPVTADQRRVLLDIAACRTAALGGHVDVCASCGFERPSYNSCRNRHCPKCQSLSQAKWIAERQARVLPTHYFHVVFTLPAELRPLALCNREKVFDLLFQCAAQTLLTLGRDSKRLGAMIGVTAVLHTWSRDLGFHPHLHCIVTGGGLSLDGARWVEGRRGYLFPVRVLGKLFRGKMLAALREAYDAGELVLEGGAAALRDTAAFAHMLDVLYKKAWGVYAKPPFGGAVQVIAYLGRYTHRVGLSNHRLLGMDERGVRFRTRGDKTVTLSADEFLRRFLLHVLPKGFVKIRHYGLMAASHATTTLEVARERIATAAAAPNPPTQDDASTGDARPEPGDWRARLEALTGIDLSACPRCGQRAMQRLALPSIPNAATPTATTPPDTS